MTLFNSAGIIVSIFNEKQRRFVSISSIYTDIQYALHILRYITDIMQLIHWLWFTEEGLANVLIIILLSDDLTVTDIKICVH